MGQDASVDADFDMKADRSASIPESWWTYSGQLWCTCGRLPTPPAPL